MYERNRGKLFKEKMNRRKSQVSFKDRLLIDFCCERVAHSDKDIAVKNLSLLNRLSSLSKFIRIITLNSRFDNVIDLHYLMTQINRIETELIPACLKQPEEVSSLVEERPLSMEELALQIDHLESQIRIWSENKQ